MSYATVGMMYPVFSPLVSHTPGSMPVYGTGRVLQEAREVNISKTFNTNPLYGDDQEVDSDNGLTALGYDFENTGLTPEDKRVLFGETLNADTLTGGQWESDNDTPYGGFAHIERMRQGDGTKKYEAYIALKIKFQETSHTARTKEGNQISWGVPRISGTAASLDVDGGESLRFRLHETFDTVGAAKAWINSILNVTATTAATT